MDYFRKYLGAQPGDAAPSGAETVERLCDRVQSSTLLDDRRDAVRALKSLSKKFRLEVGTQSMEILIGVLQTDRADSEITGYALETLCNVMSNEPSEDDDDAGPPLPEDLGIQFTEMFVKSQENITLLLSLLEDYDFHVRWPTVRLLTILLLNKGKDLQEVILVSPLGVSKLMDLLSDSREIIRNDGLLLLIQLTKGNPNIQKIVAFEGAFEKLLEIISEEGNSDGGIVVEDCLLLMLNLLKNNSSNQNFFKEGSFIKWLPAYFELESADEASGGGWSAQKVTNIHLMLQLVRTLVSPSNPTLQTISCQKVMNQCGLLQQMCSILMASGVPADVLTETINSVSEVIRGNADNQGYFASVMAPSNPPRPAIVVLLMSMVNEKQPFVLRCAVLYCFQSFLYKNELGQSQIVQTLLPSAADANSISSGQLLCGGLFSTDSLSTWLAAVALLHSIDNNTAQKEQLLRVQLATSLGNPPVSLLQQCSNILAQGGKIQTRIGLLMLICQWLSNCSIAVTHFLHNPANVPFLISQVSASEGDENEMLVQGLCAFLLGICVHFNCDQVENYHKQQLRQVIEKRIGLERFTDKLGHVSKQEVYTRAAKAPHLNYKQPHEVLFDYEFTRLFKKMENDVLKAVSPVNEKEVEETRASLDQHDSIVAQYKELIREQDQHLNSVKEELSLLQTKHAETESTREELARQVQQLKDQNALLKTRGGSGATAVENGDGGRLQQEIDAKNKQIEDSNKLIEQMKHDLEVAKEKSPPTEGSENHISQHEDVTHLSDEITELKRKVEQREEEVKLYRTKYEDTSKQLAQVREQLTSGNTEDTTNTLLLAERNAMTGQIAEKDTQIQNLQDEKSTLQQKVDSIQAENATLQQKYQAADCAVSLAEKAKQMAEEDAENIKKEQEDLLVLLTDQDNKLKDYRDRLKKHGEQVDEDDDDDDDDDLGDDLDDDDDDDENVD